MDICCILSKLKKKKKNTLWSVLVWYLSRGRLSMTSVAVFSFQLLPLDEKKKWQKTRESRESFTLAAQVEILKTFFQLHTHTHTDTHTHMHTNNVHREAQEPIWSASMCDVLWTAATPCQFWNSLSKRKDVFFRLPSPPGALPWSGTKLILASIQTNHHRPVCYVLYTVRYLCSHPFM